MNIRRCIQIVTLTLDDGTKLRFSGPAQWWGGKRFVRKISITDPRELPKVARLRGYHD